MVYYSLFGSKMGSYEEKRQERTETRMHYFIYNERKKHGTTEFPVAYYKVNCEQSGYNVPFHWHQEWELIRVLKGDFPMYIDGQEYQVRAGDVLLLRGGMLHGGNHQKCVYQCFDFDLHGLFLNVLSVKEYLRPFYRNRLHPIVHFKEYQKDMERDNLYQEVNNRIKKE